MLRGIATAVVAVILVSCQRPAASAAGECPALEKLQLANPQADASAAMSKGDHRLLALGGFARVIPGAEGSTAPTRELEGTGDAEIEACKALRPVAEDYAGAYNRAVLASASGMR